MDLMSEESVDLAQSNATNDVHRVGTWRKQPDSPLGRQVEMGKALNERRDGKITNDEWHDKADDIIRRWAD
jgi:hypothetical protein